MDNLSSYLKKFRLLISSNEDKTRIISEEIFKIINIQIPTNQISFKEGIIYISSKPIIKSELYIHKDQLIKSFKERGLSEAKELR